MRALSPWLLGALLALGPWACTNSDDGGGSNGGGDGGGNDSSSGGDGGGGGALSCTIFEQTQLLCASAPNGDIFNSIFSCDEGDSCVQPDAYNVNRDEIECVETFRYARDVFPATCGEVSAWWNDERDCVVAYHCSGSEEQPGDWQCNDGTCVCPSGGNCPVPLPPGEDVGPGEDAGGSDDIGPSDVGPGEDVGSSDADAGAQDVPDEPPAPDAGTTDQGVPDADSGPPGPPDGS